MIAANDDEPRLLSRPDAARYCGYSLSGFSRLVSIGALPGPIPGLARWDKRAIDAKLDRISGLNKPANEDEPLTWARWKQENAG